jgi:hypothetical protein
MAALVGYPFMKIGWQIAIAAIFATSTAWAEEVRFDSTKCSANADGMVYVALQKEVFRFPENELGMLGGWSEKEAADLPTPPSPTDPEGCPGNPIRARSASFLYLYEAVKADKFDPQTPKWAPNSLEIIAVPPSYWGLQDSAENQFKEICAKWNEKAVLVNQMVSCSRPPDDRTVPRNRWTTLYQAPLGLYPAPLDRLFTVHCWWPVTLSICDVRYKFIDSVNLEYEFREGSPPVERIIDFDTQLRNRLQVAIVPNYPWR